MPIICLSLCCQRITTRLFQRKKNIKKRGHPKSSDGFFNFYENIKKKNWIGVSNPQTKRIKNDLHIKYLHENIKPLLNCNRLVDFLNIKNFFLNVYSFKIKFIDFLFIRLN